MPSRLRMEQSCNVFCHGGLFGHNNRNPSQIASFTLPSRPTLARERWIELLILAASGFNQFTFVFCNPNEIDGTCDLSQDMFDGFEMDYVGKGRKSQVVQE